MINIGQSISISESIDINELNFDCTFFSSLHREGRIYFVPKIEDQDADLALAYGGVARAYVGKKQARNDSDDEHLAYG